MKKSNLNINKQFMIGNGLMVVGVFAVILIFLYISFRFKRDIDKKQTFDGIYNIEVSKDFAGDSLAIYINDSLLLEATMPDANTKLEIKRFSEDNVLMVVNRANDNASPFNLKKEGSNITVNKKGDMTYILEK